MTTLDDVAKIAGVSKTTVSRVLNNRGYISETTREKVYNAINKLNYRPNEAARNLLKQRSGIVGLLVPDVRYPFFSNIVLHTEAELTRRGYKMMLLNTYNIRSMKIDALDAFLNSNVDGLILCNYQCMHDDFMRLDCPIVSIDKYMSDGVSTVSSDHTNGGRLAAQLLIENKCKNIIQIVGSDNKKTPWSERHIVFEKTLIQNGVNCFTSYRDSCLVADFEYNRQVVREQLNLHPEADGFFGADTTALAMLKEVTASGRKVPDDFKIIACDGTDLCEMVTPTITAIRQLADRIALLSVDTVCKMIEDPLIGSCNFQIKADIVKRESTL